MYRNFGSQGRGNPTYTGGVTEANTGSPGSSSATSSQQEQFVMAGSSSQFVPSLNAITSNQDLQWLVQPSLMHSPGPSRSPVPPYPGLSGVRSLGPSTSQSHLLRPGVIRAAAHTTGLTRRRADEHLSFEEMERRRIRRERNKLAAAKCRNRRRELTDSLQSETDQLEDEKSRLQKEIAELQKEKEKLELVLEAHRPICKIEDSDSDSDPTPSVSSLGCIKIEPEDSSRPEIKLPVKMEKPKPKITIPTVSATMSAPAAAAAAATESESLHTPILTSTPSLMPFTAGMVFTYPSAPLDTNPSTTAHAVSLQGNIHQAPQACGVAHRRSSSSGDQSDHSLHSPTILTL
ncbi:fos-related antigen 1a isoform X2 [Cynoglossus semilaevis]|uniref:fos-related antigen 1a isoform X2 n=1 Tax=Cynoglossus semilaevis TaxID=244447 RepID=UPI0004979884|nr:fos-related antigen 2 isoform X2 [Cynoglossus semilaevis]XP_024918792.1 fos-related antigen 2 isoform X2 [Cynoglossus semilaevis]